MTEKILIFLFCCIFCGCHSIPPYQYADYVNGRLFVTTSIGRRALISDIYSLEYIEQEAVKKAHAAQVADANGRPPPLSDLLAGVCFPSKEQLAKMKDLYKTGDLFAYFRGSDSGWVLIRQGVVIGVWVTNHQF